MKKKKAEKAEKKPSQPRPKHEGLIHVLALGGLDIPFLGRAKEGEVTEEQLKQLLKITVDGINYVTRR